MNIPGTRDYSYDVAQTGSMFSPDFTKQLEEKSTYKVQESPETQSQPDQQAQDREKDRTQELYARDALKQNIEAEKGTTIDFFV